MIHDFRRHAIGIAVLSFASVLCADASAQSPTKTPTLGEVTSIIYRHAELLSAHDGEERACRDLRKHMGWYLRGFPVGGEFRADLARTSTYSELEGLLAPWADSEARAEDADGARGRKGSSAKVALPEGWLDDPEDETVPVGAEIENSGG